MADLRCNKHHVLIVAVRISHKIDQQNVEEVKAEKRKEVQINASNRSKKAFRKPPDRPYHENLPSPETGKICLLMSKNYVVSVLIGTTLWRLCPVFCVYNNSLGLYVHRTDALYPSWLDNIRKRGPVEIRGASNVRLSVSETVILHLFID